ncbi:MULTISPECIES: host attachment protein [unclassified Aminobacter]|jgi:protein required for attachment to host cells|uniref:baeRF12 domain-containing protein n=1 Tax=unclassified Aminobacter TaxID=2644704 RepID=UPI000466B334|nr:MULTISPECIES: host attachment protein [unclassified Aminobacter]TWG55156.1 protein required for attachment to host cells [Aminobacter sp. J44]TWH31213.1 protein required for attachment to host cells [Aminobacter sp. J15]
MILSNGTTVAVVDGGKLRLFRNKGHEPQVELASLPEPELQPANAGSGNHHRTGANNPDDNRLKEDNFAAAAAEYLNRQALAGAIEKLYVVADPRTLGEMRRRFHDVLTARVVGSLAKDLTGQGPEAIASAIVRS